MTTTSENSLPNSSTLTTENQTGSQAVNQKKDQLLLKWTAPARLFRKRGREYYTTSAALIFLIAVILFLIQEWLAIGAVLAVAFVAYVLSTVPPDSIKHRITTFGIETAGHRYSWLELFEFWFERKWDDDILVIQTRLPFPGRLHLLLAEMDKEKVKEVLQDYLPYSTEPRKTFVDYAAEWLSRKIPLEVVR